MFLCSRIVWCKVENMQIVRQILSGTFVIASLVLASVASVAPAQAWKLKVLYNFTGGADEYDAAPV